MSGMKDINTIRRVVVDLAMNDKMNQEALEETDPNVVVANCIGTLRLLMLQQIERLEVIMNNLQKINGRALIETASPPVDLGEDQEFPEYEEEEYEEAQESPTTDEGGEEIEYGEPLTPPRPTSNEYAFSYDEFTRCLTITVVEDILIRINRV